MKNDDVLWKARLHDIFANFLFCFYPTAAETFDLNKKIENLDKELEQLFPPEDDILLLGSFDKLIRVFKKNGGDQWILIHIEVQGSDDIHFAERMFTYYYRIFSTYHKQITVFTIFTDKNPSPQPLETETEVLSVFNVHKVFNQPDENFLKLDHPLEVWVAALQSVLKTRGFNEAECAATKGRFSPTEQDIASCK